METDANIADLTTVSFADFETKNRDDNARFDNYGQCQPKHDMAMALDLVLGQKSENLFETDQTPTPTRLIKNCDEVGLFEDLQHVNPFDIGFQRAAEQNAVGGHAIPVTPTRLEVPPTDGDSLHTPQVYALDTATVSAVAPAVSNSSSPLDVAVPNVEDLLKTPAPTPVPTVAQSDPPPLQLIQPQVITWVLPAQTFALSTVPVSNSKPLKSPKATQKVRPLILPKPSTKVNSKAPSAVVAASTPVHEPSSASLTPTSQLPIKERLKAILNNSYNKKQRSFETPAPKAMSAVNRNEDTMFRRRAAASRYRHKMRTEHKEIRDHNEELQKEIRVLRERIATLERELQQQNNNNNIAGVVSNQIQMPPSSIHLVINVPKMIVPSSEFSQRLDKK
ncbi:cyclic AMP-dependent transcription factor ATF-2 [Drosophila innubila]|uniref:cyclic AMP-dependent transcription factor ATF-2 n=1 Tax=Drosophila innubila TaxID=198719 RepID=UPI00148B7268|nr:cyclic AMP-dependent transcription factor ATF-2 [Drosophila innubila]